MLSYYYDTISSKLCYNTIMIQMAGKCYVDISFAALINVAVSIKIGKNNVTHV